MKIIDLNSPEYNVRTLDEMIDLMMELKERGEIVGCYFRGHRFNSGTITPDSAYKTVTGKTKEEFLQSKKQYWDEEKAKMELDQILAKIRIPYWIEEGKKFIYPQKMEKWEKCVHTRANDLYYGMDLDYALELMYALESGKSFSEVKQIVEDQNHSGSSYGIVMSMIVTFSKRGPEFYESLYENLPENVMNVLTEEKKYNKECEHELRFMFNSESKNNPRYDDERYR